MQKLITSTVAVFLLALLVGCDQPVAPTSDDDATDANSTTHQTVNVTVINHDHDDDGGGTAPPPPPPTSNRPPVLVQPGSQSNVADTVAVLRVFATDPDGDSLVWSALGLPRGLFIDQTGVITGLISSSSSDDSPFNCFVSVSDLNGGFDQVSFQWVVLPLVP